MQNQHDTTPGHTVTKPGSYTVRWTSDQYGNQYPEVDLGDGMRWVAYHSVSPITSWVDGHLVNRDDDHIVGLDIVATTAPDDHFTYDNLDLPDIRKTAVNAWQHGQVHTVNEPVTTLYTPHSQLNGDEIADTLTRFQP